jgi:GNAT superfamily N-acetyltransferase
MAGHEWRRDRHRITTDPGEMDLDVVHEFLTKSYWAGGVTRERVARSIAGSIPFGLFEGDRQVGFARVITDKVNFSWIADVWLEPALRGRGVGAWMMRFILEHPDVIHTRQTLATRDAHAFYEKLGFVRREVLRRYPGVEEPQAF